MWSWLWDICAIYGAYRIVLGSMRAATNFFSMLTENEKHKKK
jgi:hypothetical protein